MEGKDSWTSSAQIKRNVGYLPGELAFPSNMTGTQFIDFMATERQITNREKTEQLLERFELDPSSNIKQMSLGTKRKLAIVTAFMHDPAILILDEPTSGLDPLMQERFIEFILSEKEAGKSILLSSHIFSEVDATCDRIAIIKDGEIVSTIVADQLRQNKNKAFKVEFSKQEVYRHFIEQSTLDIIAERPSQSQVKIHIRDEDIHNFFKELSLYELNFISEIKFTLEDYFMDFYDRKKSIEKGKEGLSHGMY